MRGCFFSGGPGTRYPVGTSYEVGQSAAIARRATTQGWSVAYCDGNTMQAVRTVWGFIKRHRRAIGLGAVTGVAAVVALRKMKASAQNMMEEAMQEVQRMEQEQRLETHLARTRKECRRNVLVFLPMLKKRLDDRADVPAALRQAKQRLQIAQKLASWEQIKVLTPLGSLLAQQQRHCWCLCCTFSCTTGGMNMTVFECRSKAQEQEEAWARARVRAAVAADGCGAGAGAGMTQSEGDEAAETTHDFLMAAVEHLLGSGSVSGGGAEAGLDRIISLVRSIVEAETESWNISTRLKVSSEDLQSLLSTLHAKLPWNELCRCAVWDEGKQAQLLERKERKERKEAGMGSGSGSGSARARALSCLLDEALDMLESPHFERAFRESTDAAIGCVTQEIVSSAYPSPAGSGSGSGSGTSDAANIRDATAVVNAPAEKPFVAPA